MGLENVRTMVEMYGYVLRVKLTKPDLTVGYSYWSWFRVGPEVSSLYSNGKLNVFFITTFSLINIGSTSDPTLAIHSQLIQST